MGTQSLTRFGEKISPFFDDFFRPATEFFETGGLWGRIMKTPAVNIMETKNEYIISVAVPGMKKEDFKIDVEGNILTISCEKEESKEEKDFRFTRKEYNYSSFSRYFTLPDEVMWDKIDARYEDGVLKIALPLKAEAKKLTTKHISVK